MLAPGTNIGRYVVQRKLAEGGMAEIYLASAVGPEGFSKDVVIKVVRSFLSSDQQFIQMFIAEARLASRLNHANVVQIFDFGKHEESYFLAMEYVRGASLWDLRKRCRDFGVPFPPVLAAEVCAQVARGLQYAHNLTEGGTKIGVVHRDVTPHNVLLSFDGAVKLTDFGIAKATTSQTAPGMLKGKFAYMSPEQARGERVDNRTDIFALGIVLWELLTGGRLFDGDTDVAVLRAVQESLIAPPSRLNPDVPQELTDIVMKSLARKPEERFQQAFDFDRSLSNFVLKYAQTADDTSAGAFLQQMFREEFERSTVREVPRTLPAPGPFDDFGTGDTAFMKRGGKPTMTGTPVKPVPDRATPRPISKEGIEEEAPPARKPGTEQMPAHKPSAGPASRRFDPLPVAEPSLVSPVAETPAPRAPLQPVSGRASQRLRPLTERPPEGVTAQPEVLSQRAIPLTERASEIREEVRSESAVVPPARSKAPFIVIGLLVVGLGIGAAFIGLKSEPEPVSPAVVQPVAVFAEPAKSKEAEPVAVAPSQEAAAVIDAGVVLEHAPTEVATAVEVEPKPAPPEPSPPVVDAGRTATAPPPAPTPVAKRVVTRATGSLSISARPFAIVSENGHDLGEVTGTKLFVLPVGAHTVKLVRNATVKTEHVVIKAGETTSLEFSAE